MRIVRYYPRAAVGDGGITTAIRGWARASIEAGAEVKIACDPRYSPEAVASNPLYLPVSHVGSGYLRVPTGMSKALEDADLLVLHSGWVLYNVVAARAARAAGVPYVVEPRGAYDAHIMQRRARIKRLWWKVFEERLLRDSLAVHVFFESEIEYLRALGYSGPVVVAPNGVEVVEDVSWKGGTDLVWLGRFDPEHKGLDLLLDAVARIEDGRRPLLRLYGPDWRGKKQVVRSLVRERGLEEWIDVAEPVYGEAKWTVLKNARGFVYPSRWEGFGIALAEAVSIGCPALVTPYPFGRFLAERGGAFIATADAEGLAKGLLELTDSTRAAAVGRNAARIVREELSWSDVTGRWLSQVNDLVVHV